MGCTGQGTPIEEDGMEPEEGMPLADELPAGEEVQPAPDGLTKLTVNLVPAAYVSLLETAKITGDTRTDTVNRALQLYAFLEARKAEGWLPALMRDGAIRTFDLT